MLFGQFLAIYPYDETGALRKAMPPVIRLALDVAPERVGEAVLSSLARSAKRRWLPRFLRRHDAHSEALTLLGAGSESAFLNKGAVVSVSERAEHIKLARLLRDRGGWRGEPSISLPRGSSSADLGRAVVGLIAPSSQLQESTSREESRQTSRPLATRLAAQEHRRCTDSSRRREARSEPLPDSPVPFGYKTCWLAVRCEDTLAVAAALGLADHAPASWAHGVEVAYNGGLFITPPIDGWTLVVGAAVAPGVDQPHGGWRSNMIELSGRFGEVQMFASHRVVELHGWARARSGVLDRAYCYVGESGEVVYDEGPQTAEERELGFDFGDPECAEAADEAYWERDHLFPDEGSVMALARKWSVSPVELSEQSAPPGLGLVPVRQRRPWWRFW